MPICTVELFSLHNPSVPTFLRLLRQQSPTIKPLVTARVIRWIITPSLHQHKEALINQNHPWHILLIYPGLRCSFPSEIETVIQARYSIQAGIPASIMASFKDKNEQYLRPKTSDVPPLTGTLSQSGAAAGNSQNLELDQELLSWVTDGKDRPRGAVSMLNLLQFCEGKEGMYGEYGKRFSEDVGRKRGGVAKLVGRVVPSGEDEDGGGGGWDEMALAHYPSLEHFADMLAGEDYQEVNREFRLPSLRDTCILCTSEVDFGAEGRARL